MVLGQAGALTHALAVTVRVEPGGGGALQPLAAAVLVLLPSVRVHVLQQLALPEKRAAAHGAADLSLP